MSLADRIEPPGDADERTTLVAFLDYYRSTLALKCDGLDAAQLADRKVEPSPLSLLGLVRHIADVERDLAPTIAGEQTHGRYYDKDDPDGDFTNVAADPDQVSDAYAYWESEIAHAREVYDAHSLDDAFTDRWGRRLSLRWIYVHLIEEYARHCGHADFLRERIDGATGD